ncbi:BspA family leucine-rich repeat surface protein [Shewanella submarina]|uniref:BspA family leucine-rich repeat surface protein n=1 Tax=Shewanella submarina TaxID=2016376 RepID=A0ABV7GCG3_9GAMM|nr:BspA family leucine-rich repeat surface protein [Shewanella submarina]MCL1036636.1 BspA family leucine-rich repeat surface protein [Shewanella submarina]
MKSKTTTTPSLCYLLFSLPLFLYNPAGFAAAQDDFVITVKTDNAGVSSNVQFTLPTTGGGYNYNIDCDNDGSDEATAQTGSYTCDYTGLGGAGTYTVRVKDNSGSGTGFPRVYFNNTGDKLKILSVEQWGSGSWQSMANAFYGAANMTVPATDVPDLSGATDMSNMFSGASLANPDVSSWNVTNIQQMSALFRDATSANPDVSSWDVSNVTTMSFMFAGATIATPNTSNWNVANVSSMSDMFFGASAANPDVSNWNTSSVTNMKSLFLNATSATPDVSNWDTSAVTNMRSLFNGATSANPDVSNWDTSSATSMYAMFFNATSATPNTANWDTSSVTTMRSMFSGATAANPDVSNWDTSSATSMYAMFFNATSATPNTANWDTSSVTTMRSMFSGATAANPDVSNWNTSSVNSMELMFYNASSAAPNVTSWDTSAVTNMSSMFSGATSANPLVGNWTVTSVTQMSNMFNGVTLTTDAYDAILSAWNAQSLQSGVSFNGGNSTYCESGGARSNIISTYSWSISDGGQDCTPDTPSTAPDMLASSDSGSSAVDNITSDNTPTFNLQCSESGNTITLYSDSPATNTSIATLVCSATGTVQITSSTLADGVHNISYTDTKSGDESSASSSLQVEVDTSAATLAEVAAVSSPTSDNTPSYSFSSTEAGTISYSGSCSSPTTSAVVGTNTVTFNALADGLYSNCQLQVTDQAGNTSTQFSITAFEVDTAAATLAEVTPVSSPTSDNTPSYSFSSTEAGTISYSGSCSAPTTSAVVGTNTVTFNALADGLYSNCQLQLTDQAGNTSTRLSITAFEVDTTAATLAEITSVSSPTSNNTPSYSFSSTEAGTISYSGSCSSPTTSAVVGTNTVTFNALADGLYNDCQLKLTDQAGNTSVQLSITAFEVDTAAATLAEVTAVSSPTSDNTPSYSFSTTEAGTISYSGSCSSPTTSAVVGVNTLEFNGLANGTYSDCALRLTDISGNVSPPLNVTEFTVDTLLLGLEINLPSEVLQNEELIIEPRLTGGKSPFIFSAENLPGWIQQDTGSGQLTVSPVQEDVGSYAGIVFQVSDSEGRVASSQPFEIRVVAVNSPPVAQDDTLTFIGGTISVAVLDNDWDPDEGDTLTITNATALSGSVTLDGDNLMYQSPTNFTGMDIIDYTISDSSGLTASAKVSISVVHDDSLGGAPQISPPADVEVNATGLLTRVTLGYATAIDYLGNPLSVTRSSGTVFRPGVHQVLWTAEDSQGRKTSLVQQVIVHPLISIAPGSRVQEGESTSVEVYLNGDAPQYPVRIPYSIAGTADEDDHDLDEENITVAEGWNSQINFSTLPDNVTEEDETLIIQLDETMNLARQASYTLTISEMPGAPGVSLKSYQDGIETLEINQSQGVVTVKSVNISGNTENAQLRWETSQQVVNLSNDPRLFKFAPQELDPGNLHITLTVNAINATQTTTSINLALSEKADVIQPSKSCSIINEQIDDGFWFLAETEPRACIMRGNTALNSHSGGIQILSEEQKQLLGTELPLDKGVFDFTLFGKSAGDSYQVVLPQRKPIPEQATYLIYSTESGDWREFQTDAENSLFSAPSSEGLCPEIGANHWRPGLTAGDWCVRLTIEDGGPNDTDSAPDAIVSATTALTDSAYKDGSNKAPVAQNDLFEITATQDTQLQVLVNDSDEDGDQLILVEADAELGAVEIVGDDIRYILPAEDFLGQDTIKYLISDQQGGFASALATIEVTSGNTLPVAQDDRLTIFVNSYGVADVLANDSDPDNTPLSIEQVTSDSGHTWVRNGKLYIVPELDFIGTISVSYLAVDSKGGKAKAGLTVKVIKPLYVTSGGSSDGHIMLILLAILIARICSPLMNRARYTRNQSGNQAI